MANAIRVRKKVGRLGDCVQVQGSGCISNVYARDSLSQPQRGQPALADVNYIGHGVYVSEQHKCLVCERCRIVLESSKLVEHLAFKHYQLLTSSEKAQLLQVKLPAWRPAPSVTITAVPFIEVHDGHLCMNCNKCWMNIENALCCRNIAGRYFRSARVQKLAGYGNETTAIPVMEKTKSTKSAPVADISDDLVTHSCPPAPRNRAQKVVRYRAVALQTRCLIAEARASINAKNREDAETRLSHVIAELELLKGKCLIQQRLLRSLQID